MMTSFVKNDVITLTCMDDVAQKDMKMNDSEKRKNEGDRRKKERTHHLDTRIDTSYHIPIITYLLLSSQLS